MYLAKGSHRPESGQHCAMEWLCWATGLPHADDHPAVGPRWASIIRLTNDLLEADERDQLVPRVLDVIGRPDLSREARQQLATALVLAPTSPERLAIWQRAVGHAGLDWVPNAPESPPNGVATPSHPSESLEYAP